MYKLVYVAGKLRGKEVYLKAGENILGRDPSLDLIIPLDGVSKKHFSITVLDDLVTLNDLGSANGTFYNGRLVKKATLQAGDKIGIPNAIFQIVYVQEKKKIITKKVATAKEREVSYEEALSGGEAPESLAEKIFWIFRYKIMRPLYGLNQEYEWRYMLAIFTILFVIATITLTIYPVLQDSRGILMREIANRGEHYAKEIARINAVALEQGQLEKVDTKFLDDGNEEGVVSYELFDLMGRVVRPISKLNEITNDPFSVKTKEELNRGNGRNIYLRQLDNNQIGIGKVITAINSKTGNVEPVGYIAIRFAPVSLVTEAANSAKAYLESLITSLLVAVIFFGIIYFLTQRHFEILRLQIEEAMRGKRRQVETKFLFEEMNPVVNSVNTILQRLRELQKSDDEIDPNDIEDDSQYVNTLIEFLQGSGSPTIVLNSNKNLMRLNTMAEDLCGIRQSMSEGMSILDITKERGFAATLIELCDQSANNMGTSQQGQYELQGKSYNVFVNALMGKDGFAKGFYITMVLD